MLGFVFPGETAAILGGVLASKGGVASPASSPRDPVRHRRRLGRLLRRRYVGPSAPGARSPAQTPEGHRHRARPVAQTRRVAVFVGRFSAFLRAVIPGLAGLSKMRYRVFLPANALGGSAGACSTSCWATSSASGSRRPPASRRHPARPHRRRHRGPRRAPPPQGEARDRGAVGGRRTRERHGPLTADGRLRPAGRGPSGPRRAGRRARRANSPAASSPCASVSSQRTASGRCGPGRRGRSAARRCPTRSCPRATSAGRPARHAGRHGVGHCPEVLAHVARPVHAVLRGGAARRAPGSPCRSRPPTAGARGAGPTRWRTRTQRAGCDSSPRGRARRTSSRARRPGGGPGRGWRGWPRGRTSRSRRRRGCGPRRRVRRRRPRGAARPGVRPRRRAQAAPQPGCLEPYGDTAAKNRRSAASPAWCGGNAASCTARRSSM